MKVLGIIFAGDRGELLEKLTNKRTPAALPIYGKYRIIDFSLSNMVNAGISKIGIVTQYNPRSLMDHIGSGKEWDLDRKNGGVYFLQPYVTPNSESLGYMGNADALFKNMDILKRGNEDYVLICSGKQIYKIDFNKMFQSHIESGADITVLGSNSKEHNDMKISNLAKTNEDGRIVEWISNPGEKFKIDKNHTHVLNAFFMNKFLLKELLFATVPEGNFDLIDGIIRNNIDSLVINAYNFYGFWRNIKRDVNSYFETCLSILNDEIRKELFYEHGRVYTKLKDLPPPKITNTGVIKNSIVADGSFINGKIEDSIISRSTRILAGASVKNSVILEGCTIEEGACVENAILDKDCTIRIGKKFLGKPNSPKILEKNGVF